MTIQHEAPVRSGPSARLGALFLATFVLGSAELIVVGVLDLISADLGVSEVAAGTLVTAYALGIAIGGPLLTALTIRVNKRALLIGGVFLCAVAAVVPVLIANFALFVTARAVAGVCHGVFLSVAFVTATSLVPPERAGRAVSMVLSGVAVSAALGLPLGTLVGHGLGWRGSFFAIGALAVVALVGVVLLIPNVRADGDNAVSQARYAFAPRVLFVLVLNCVLFASLYAALTYIVPFLQGVTAISGVAVSAFLLAYGVATAVGSFGGGRFADRNAAGALIVGAVGATVSLVGLYFVGTIPVLVALVMFFWGLFAFGVTPSIQLRVVNLAGPGGQLAASLPASAVNVGIAVGPLAGGLALTSAGASGPVVAGAVLGVVGIVLAWATSYLKPPVVEQGTTGAAEASSAGEASPMTDASPAETAGGGQA